MSIGLNNFRDSLFWDVNLKRLDVEKNSRFIIGRVLDSGNLKEWQLIKQLYGKKRVAQIAKGHVFTDPRGANFWALILSIPVSQMKCTRKPSLKTPNTFSSY